MNEQPIKTVTLENTEDNHFKVWVGEFYRDNEGKEKIITRWGRIGYELSSKEFPGETEADFDKKVATKIKKGYVVVIDE